MPLYDTANTDHCAGYSPRFLKHASTLGLIMESTSDPIRSERKLHVDGTYSLALSEEHVRSIVRFDQL
jgi:hypothetical protein